eukprot:CAMPEP_0117006780 /NCGR_PEP_ID=MMETSP0472-20121206/6889_1 /TAXON_ID=693140 ORGANISM="Tiarina fusus, Strain LIS" /NCGR_SAMPLE_ID=MMETSP0472 /ASSEMBLY_ACC=CAM_ASM_000603 /LENGTH=31 /DNA_ID= /DNA_START= /DNA_END= /DNA_ORIENTATION=
MTLNKREKNEESGYQKNDLDSNNLHKVSQQR